MSQLRIETLVMPAADVGLPNPLPALPLVDHTSAPPKVHENVPAEARRFLNYGCDTGCLPYLLQDGYDRHQTPRPFNVAVLENDLLRATFLLEFGGRLWSLWHKPSQRELLFRNPVFQPRNLAVRNAWFAGGVEWNAGVQGHSPLSCSPIFAARVNADDGSPILRLYEWERIRCFPYQMDFWLPENSPWLFVRVRLINPHDRTIPMYWWSNIAVPEAPDVRVLAPADAAYNFGYSNQMRIVPIPRLEDGTDVTYPQNARGSADYFYSIDRQHRRWIAALDASGSGLIQASTSEQRGRKLFVWGMNPGGRRWQQFLSTPDKPYIEIQAGVAQTQFECFPMSPKSELAWTEAYGLMIAGDAHHADWLRARASVEDELAQALPQSDLDQVHATASRFADRAPAEILYRGSGWGALESQRRAASGESSNSFPGLVFDQESLTDEQAPWRAILEHGRFPEPSTAHATSSWMIQDEWQTLLQQSIDDGHSHWFAWLHMGTMLFARGRVDPAREAWKTSLGLKRSAWALRNLAICEMRDKNLGAAADLLLEAREMLPDLWPLAAECLHALLAAGRAQDLMRLLPSLPEAVRTRGRVRILEARAAADLEDLALAESILMDEDLEVADLREGEQLLSELWHALQIKKASLEKKIPVNPQLEVWVRRHRPPPNRIDFRQAYAED